MYHYQVVVGGWLAGCSFVMLEGDRLVVSLCPSDGSFTSIVFCFGVCFCFRGAPMLPRDTCRVCWILTRLPLRSRGRISSHISRMCSLGTLCPNTTLCGRLLSFLLLRPLLHALLGYCHAPLLVTSLFLPPPQCFSSGASGPRLFVRISFW